MRAAYTLLILKRELLHTTSHNYILRLNRVIGRNIWYRDVLRSATD